MTPLERKLAEIPRREVPPEWREQILPPRKNEPAPALLLLGLKRLFSFPHPLAWGAVGAAWVAIAALNFSGPRGPELYAVTPAAYRDRLPDSREYLARYILQQRLIAAMLQESQDEPWLYRRDL